MQSLNPEDVADQDHRRSRSLRARMGAWLRPPRVDLSDVLIALMRQEQLLHRIEGLIMAADRDLARKLLTALPAIISRVRELITDNENKARRIAELQGAAATDEAEDTAAWQPLDDAVTSLEGLVNPAAEEAPDVTPVETVEEVPAVIDEAPRDDAPAEAPADASVDGENR